MLLLGLKEKKYIIWPWHLQVEFNDIFGACNRFFSMCFEHVHKKNHVVEYLVKQGIFGEDDLVVWI